MSDKQELSTIDLEIKIGKDTTVTFKATNLTSEDKQGFVSTLNTMAVIMDNIIKSQQHPPFRPQNDEVIMDNIFKPQDDEEIIN